VTSSRFIAAARYEFLGQVAYYAAENLGVGERFSRAVEGAVSLAMAFPESGSPGPRNTRRIRVRGCPFSIVYRREGDVIVVFAVAHQSRRPEYWISRVPSEDD
jgi:plasmid stabilization system protein ParE